MIKENMELTELVKEVCDILKTKYVYEDEVYYLQVKTEDGHEEEVSIYETIDSYELSKIDCAVTIGPVIKNVDLLYTFLKNNFELDYGAFAIIHEDDIDLLVLVESLLTDSCSAEELATVTAYLAEIAHETRELISKF